MCAVDEGHYTVAEVLLRMKADVTHTTKDGINALSLAVRRNTQTGKCSKVDAKDAAVSE